MSRRTNPGRRDFFGLVGLSAAALLIPTALQARCRRRWRNSCMPCCPSTECGPIRLDGTASVQQPAIDFRSATRDDIEQPAAEVRAGQFTMQAFFKNNSGGEILLCGCLKNKPTAYLQLGTVDHKSATAGLPVLCEPFYSPIKLKPGETYPFDISDRKWTCNLAMFIWGNVGQVGNILVTDDKHYFPYLHFEYSGGNNWKNYSSINP
jgi:hypothetical protein